MVFVTMIIFSSTCFAQLKTIYNFKDEALPFNNFGFKYSTELGGKLIFFTAGSKGDECDHSIWQSNGTSEGTKVFGSLPCDDRSDFFTKVGDLLFFTTEDDSQNYKLWKTDGTASGTSELKAVVWPRNFVACNDLLYFTTGIRDQKRELWRSDGTPEGTFPIYTFSDATSRVFDLKAGESQLFFITTDDAEDERHLWTTDGTPEGTQKVRSFHSYSNSSRLWLSFSFRGSTILNDIIYFPAYEQETGLELWQSDGTLSGTKMISDLTPGQDPEDSLGLSSVIYSFFNIRDKACFFKYKDGKTELWSSDGTTQGTQKTHLILDEQDNNIITRFGKPFELNDRVLLELDNGRLGYELWVENTTSKAFSILKDIRPGKRSSVKYNFPRFEYKQNLYFLANDGQYGMELWKTDGTKENTHIVADLNSGAAWTFYYSSLTVIGDHLFFFNLADDESLQLNTLDLGAEFTPPSLPVELAENEWFRSIGVKSRFGSTFHTWNDEIITDKQSNVYVSGKSMSINTGLEFYDNNETLFANPANRSEGNFIAKFDKRGDLLWSKHVGGTNEFQSNTILAMTPSDHLVIGNTFYKSAGFDSLRIDANSYKMYLAQLSPEGNLEWIKTFDQRGRFNKIQIDKDGNIYAGGLYWNFSFNLGSGVSLSSEASPQYFVAKFDPFGNALWAKNVDHVGDTFGTLTDLKIDPNGTIYSLVTQGTAYTSSSCKYQPWGIYYLIRIIITS